jgi:peptide/nickel transport system substrate-binding protein
MFRKRWMQLIGVGVLCAAIAGCGSSGSSTTSASGGTTTGSATGTSSNTLRIAYQANIASFDPDNSFEVAGLGAIRAVYEGLVAYAPNSTKLIGLLAKTWTISSDGKTYTFHLRTGVKFHDGTTMTASSVKAAFERRRNPKLILSYFLAGVKSMSAPNAQTFVVNLTSAEPYFLDSLASAWGPKVVGPNALVAHAGKDFSQSYLNSHADGTGPYMLTNFSQGQSYTLTRFDNYWGQKAYFQTVKIAVIPSIEQQILELKSGQLDMVLHGYPFDQLQTVSSPLHIFRYTDLGLEMGYINASGPLKNTAYRQRVVAALNPSGWVNEAFGTYATTAHSLFPKLMPQPPQPLVYPTSTSGGGKIPTVRVIYTQEEAGVQQRVTDLLVARLQAAGISASARAVPQAQVTSWYKDPASAPADLVVVQENPDDASPQSMVGDFYVSGSPLNVFNYSNPSATKDFNKAFTLADASAANSLYFSGTKTLFGDGAFLPFADVDDVIVYRGNLTDFNPIPAVPWNINLGTVREG